MSESRQYIKGILEEFLALGERFTLQDLIVRAENAGGTALQATTILDEWRSMKKVKPANHFAVRSRVTYWKKA